MKTIQLIRILVSALILSIFSACGGGGGSSSAPATTPVQADVCYVANPNAGKPCIVNDAAVTTGTLNVGDTARLKNLFARASQGGHYVIGFIGGSITRGEKVISLPNTTPDETYTWMVYRWFQRTFPKATFSYENAAISGTDCVDGDARLQTDLLAFQPDFVITEWAVNDSAPTPEQVTQAYGDVIDRIEALPNQPAVLMLITMAGDGENWDYKDIPVGMSHNVPILSEKTFLLPLQQAGNINETDWNADGTHPDVLGMDILGALVNQFLTRQLPQ
jgi:lysophospholipase L1-like esterase